MFLNRCNVLILKIFFKIKNIILIYYQTKITLKNNFYHTLHLEL